MKWYEDTVRTIIMYYSIFVVVSLNIINELILLYRNTVYFTTECEHDSSNSETFVLSKSEKILSSSSCMCFHIHWWMQQRNGIVYMPLIQSIIHPTNRYCIYCTTTTTMDETISSNSTLAPNEEAFTINWDAHIEEIIVFAAGGLIVVIILSSRRVRKAIFSGVTNNESNDETNDESNDEETNIFSPG